VLAATHGLLYEHRVTAATDLRHPLDQRGRGLTDLRISVTDRCNFRCGYCMPKDVFHDGYQFLPRADVLSYEEITRIARIAVCALGVQKLRITGGEPLVRRDLPRLIDALARIDGVQDLALTTNGLLLAEHAGALARAGLKRATVSLDALDAPTFARMSGTSHSPARVLEGIAAAAEAGLSPIKINCVVIRGQNDHAITELVEHFRGTSHVLRFIEYMDVGNINGWSAEQVFGADEILARIAAVAPIEPVGDARGAGVAERYRFTDDSAEIGVIASVTRPFCGDCQRSRLAADGRFLTCLFAAGGLQLRERLRGGEGDEAIAQAMATTWRSRNDRYSELRSPLGDPRRRKLEMYQVGG